MFGSFDSRKLKKYVAGNSYSAMEFNKELKKRMNHVYFFIWIFFIAAKYMDSMNETIIRSFH